MMNLERCIEHVRQGSADPRGGRVAMDADKELASLRADLATLKAENAAQAAEIERQNESLGFWGRATARSLRERDEAVALLRGMERIYRESRCCMDAAHFGAVQSFLQAHPQPAESEKASDG